jgi:hypothetical protein
MCTAVPYRLKAMLKNMSNLAEDLIQLHVVVEAVNRTRTALVEDTGCSLNFL